MIDGSRPAKAAARQLLGAVSAWSPRYAVWLLRWLESHKVTWHDEALIALLNMGTGADGSAALALEALVELVLPIATEGNADVIASLVAVYAARHGTAQTEERCRTLVAAIETTALPSTRREWRRGVARILYGLGIAPAVTGLTDADLGPQEDRHHSSDILKLRDGTTLSADEVLVRTSSVADAAALRAEESDDSWVHWEGTIERLAQTAGREDVDRLRNTFTGWQYASLALAILSERLFALGDRAGAWSLASEALAAPNEYARFGWDHYHDGGRRIACCNALLSIDANRARPIIFDKLIEDLAGDSWFPRAFALSLTDILPLLTPDVPVVAVWEEVEWHVHALFETVSLDATPTHEIVAPDASDTADRAFADLILAHMSHPVAVLAHGALRAATARLLDDDATMRDAVGEGLDGEEPLQEACLIALDAVSLRDPAMVAPLSNAVASLGDAPSFAIRETARAICARLGLTAAIPSSKVPPSIYGLMLPPQLGRVVADRPTPASAPIPDSDNPTDALAAFHTHLDAIAERAGLDATAVRFRAAQVMRELAPPEAWSERGEARLRDELYAAHLRLTYTRPRAALAKRAMFHVAAELADGGLLDADDLDALRPLLRHYDPHAVLIRPLPRPAAVAAMAGPGERWKVDADWLSATEASIAFAARTTPDGYVVLAEETSYLRLGRVQPREVRRSVVARLEDLSPGTGNTEAGVGRTLNELIAEYPSAVPYRSSGAIIIRNTAHWRDTPYKDWIALNPTIGYALGWLASTEGLFRWTDATGRIMVETFLWADGTPQTDVSEGDIVGNGWLVVASPEAVVQLKGYARSMLRSIDTKRTYGDDSSSARAATYETV